ncbi:hypothetical protein M9435_001338 [Picochlorum sp. BPE23]|nr:hypothetical protein M9435_001338 [Picochlorum sp. BPE23]
MGKKRKKTHIVEDQFGEGGVSQDKEFAPPRSGGPGSSKGGGGGSVPGSTPFHYVKHVPKFLQSHAHLLGQKPANIGTTDEDASDAQIHPQNDDGDDDETEEEKRMALLQALEQNPELAHEYPELLDLKKERDAAQLKAQGNEAFRKEAYRDAIDLFSKCIELDPTNHTYYSNRAAAYIRIEAWEDAIQDGRECVRRAPDWAKGYVRLGTALCQSPHTAAEAVYVLKKAKTLDPDMQGIDELLAQAQTTKDTLQEPKEKKTKGSSLLLSFNEEGEENEDE